MHGTSYIANLENRLKNLEGPGYVPGLVELTELRKSGHASVQYCPYLRLKVDRSNIL